MEKCPICEKGRLKPVKENHVMFGVDLGVYPGERCTSCNELFTDGKIMNEIEDAAKKNGIWGLGKKTTIGRTGNSLAVRIPHNIVKYLNLKEGKEAYIHPEQNKLVIDIG